MNKLAINLSPDFVDHRYFEVLIVPQAVIAIVLRHLFAVRDRFGIRAEINADPVSKGTPSFMSKKKFRTVRAFLCWCLQTWGR
jgi:hypothetical protein